MFNINGSSISVKKSINKSHKLCGSKNIREKSIHVSLIAGLSLGLLSANVLADSKSLPALNLESMGQFIVSGTKQVSDTRGGFHYFDQANVLYLISKQKNKVPVVFIPGTGLNSSIYTSTPDNREGWAQIFARFGHSTYAFNTPNRGASRLRVQETNACIAAGRVLATGTQSLCAAAITSSITSTESQWSTWGVGPTYGTAWSDTQFPVADWDYQFAGAFDVSQSSPGNVNEKALIALLERIGPAVVVSHSSSGSFGFEAMRNRPDLFKGFVSIENTSCPTTPETVSPFVEVPFLGIYGDHVTERQGGGHANRRTACAATAQNLQDLKGDGTFIDLPVDNKIYGSSHLMMQDKNNVELAKIIDSWMQKHVENKK